MIIVSINFNNLAHFIYLCISVSPQFDLTHDNFWQKIDRYMDCVSILVSACHLQNLIFFEPTKFYNDQNLQGPPRALILK